MNLKGEDQKKVRKVERKILWKIMLELEEKDEFDVLLLKEPLE